MITDLLILPTLLCSASAPAIQQPLSNDLDKQPPIVEKYEREDAVNDVDDSGEGGTRSYYDLDLNWNELVALLSLTPSQLVLAISARDKALDMTAYLYPNTSNYQDDGDAFRHTYFSALLAKTISDDFSSRLLAAHESQQPAGLDKNMDLHNNDNGIILYHEWVDKINYTGSSPLDDLAYFICHCIANGEIYDCVKINTNINKMVYTTVGINNASTYGIKGYIDQIDPDDYEFEAQYFFYNKTKYVATYNDVTIETRRLRTGYIEEEYIVLSPRRQNAGYAYFDMYFPTPIIAIDLDICLWSNNEYLDPNSCSANLSKMTSYNDYINYYDLLNEYSLSTNRANPNRLRFNFNNQASGIRFSVQAPAVGDRNKGRLCIGNMHILFANPNY